MLQTSRILVRAINHAVCAGMAAIALLGLPGCGQTGRLYLPTEPAATNRATLPESLWPTLPKKKENAEPGATPPTTSPASSTETVKP